MKILSVPAGEPVLQTPPLRTAEKLPACCATGFRGIIAQQRLLVTVSFPIDSAIIWFPYGGFHR